MAINSFAVLSYSTFLPLIIAAYTANLARGETLGFLQATADAAAVDAAAFQAELQSAIGGALGCGDPLAPDRHAQVQEALQPLWHAARKNSQGRVGSGALRRMAHRYFMQHFAIVLRGFENPHAMNRSDWGMADLLSGRMPKYLEYVLAKQHASEIGFGLEDVASAVLMLEQLISDAEISLLQEVYQSRHRATSTMSPEDLRRLLEDYVVHWMMGHDKEGISILLGNRTVLEQSFPHWHELSAFIKGQIKALDFAQQHSVARSTPPKPRGFRYADRYGLDDAHAVVGGLTRSFGSFWEQECTSLKMGLVEMDTKRTGRVPLAKFYSAALGSEWRYGESESYLREAGVLDEKSHWVGKQVVIANYVQAASNCIVTTPHYSICCMDECERILAEIEAVVGSSTAPPELLLGIIENISAANSIDDEVEEPKLAGALSSQLMAIARRHAGEVPFHSHLFEQWLHFVFPHQCALPSHPGTTPPRALAELGDSFIATQAEMQSHAQNTSQLLDDVNASFGDLVAGIQEEKWTWEEELLLDYAAGELQAPWEGGNYRSLLAIAGILALLLFGVAGLANAGPKAAPVAASSRKAACGHMV